MLSLGCSFDFVLLVVGCLLSAGDELDIGVDCVKALRIMFYSTARDTGPIPANILKNLLRAPARAHRQAGFDQMIDLALSPFPARLVRMDAGFPIHSRESKKLRRTSPPGYGFVTRIGLSPTSC